MDKLRESVIVVLMSGAIWLAVLLVSLGRL